MDVLDYCSLCNWVWQMYYISLSQSFWCLPLWTVNFTWLSPYRWHGNIRCISCFSDRTKYSRFAVKSQPLPCGWKTNSMGFVPQTVTWEDGRGELLEINPAYAFDFPRCRTRAVSSSMSQCVPQGAPGRSGGVWWTRHVERFINNSQPSSQPLIILCWVKHEEPVLQTGLSVCR